MEAQEAADAATATSTTAVVFPILIVIIVTIITTTIVPTVIIDIPITVKITMLRIYPLASRFLLVRICARNIGNSYGYQAWLMSIGLMMTLAFDFLGLGSGFGRSGFWVGRRKLQGCGARRSTGQRSSFATAYSVLSGAFVTVQE